MNNWVYIEFNPVILHLKPFDINLIQKMKLTVILCLFVAILLVACNGKSKKTAQAVTTNTTKGDTLNQEAVMEPVEIEETPTMSGWKCYGLQGRVKSVKYTNGSSFDFNTDGNLIKKREILDSGTSSDEYIYQTPTQYTKIYSSDQDYKPKYKISMKANTRIETLIEGDGCDQDIVYVFDKLGRLAEEREESSCDYYYEHKYMYAAESAFLPDKSIKVSETYGDGTNTYKTEYKYEYVKKDNKGNWLERHATLKMTESTPNWDEINNEEKIKVTTATKTLIEKREITYY